MSWIKKQVDQLRNSITDPYVSDTLKESANAVLNAILTKLSEGSTASEPDMQELLEEQRRIEAEAKRQRLQRILLIGGISVGLLIGGFYAYKALKK